MARFYGWGSTFSWLQSHYEEVVYSLSSDIPLFGPRLEFLAAGAHMTNSSRFEHLYYINGFSFPLKLYKFCDVRKDMMQ